MVITNVERTKPWGADQIGVVKVELDSIDDKIDVLHAKKKCDSEDKSERITIRSCESHVERVARINTKFLLGKLDL